MPYQTLCQIYIAVEELSAWWDEHHRDDEGHHTDEWVNIEGGAHEEFFRCLIDDLCAQMSGHARLEAEKATVEAKTARAQRTMWETRARELGWKPEE